MGCGAVLRQGLCSDVQLGLRVTNTAVLDHTVGLCKGRIHRSGSTVVCYYVPAILPLHTSRVHGGKHGARKEQEETHILGCGDPADQHNRIGRVQVCVRMPACMSRTLTPAVALRAGCSPHRHRLLAQRVGRAVEAHYGAGSLTLAIQDGPLAGGRGVGARWTGCGVHDHVSTCYAWLGSNVGFCGNRMLTRGAP